MSESDVRVRDVIIAGLRKALRFYADEKNYVQRGWQGDPDKSQVDVDNGKIARDTLGKER